MDLQQQIDQSFGSGPDHRDIDAVLEAGRRAHQRRRAASGACAVLVALAVGGISWLSVSGDSDSRSTDVATTPSTSASPSAASPLETAPAPPEPPAQYVHGEVRTADGARVIQRVENPLEVQPPARSVGLVVERDGTTYWLLLQADTEGSGTSWDEAHKGFATFGQWLDDQVALQKGDRPPHQFVEFGPDGRLRPLDGAEIVEQRTGVFVGESFAPHGAQTAAALVTKNRISWFVIARDIDGPPEYFPANTPKAGTTLDSFLDYARQQYGAGPSEGLR